MHAEERIHGNFRIRGRARSAPAGGFVAAVAVHRVSAEGAAAKPVFSNEALFDGNPFERAEDALACALNVGYREVRLASGTV